MKISFFPSVKRPKEGVVLTAEKFHAVSDDNSLLDIIKEIRNLSTDPANDERVSELKKKLPIITWQASFVDNHRVEAKAIPSGLYMLDIDHPTPEQLAKIKITAFRKLKELKIVYIGETPRCGLRIVAECLPECSTIADMQQYLAKALEVDEGLLDEVCTDWARSSFMVHSSLVSYLDATIFSREPSTVYVNERFEDASTTATPTAETEKPGQQLKAFDVPDSGQTEFQGIPLKKIAVEWLSQNGGEPSKGNRNTQIFKLATRMRYICDFNEAVLYNNIPNYGLGAKEMRAVIHSANVFARSAEIPKDLIDVIEQCQKLNALDEEEDIELIDINDTSKTPNLPPIFNEWYSIAPNDFKLPTVLVQLPILGALGSKLRAVYLDGKKHSPTFQVSLEAPQASGKSFMTEIVNYDLALMKEHDQAERLKEREYNDKVKEIKLLNTKVTKKNKEEVLGERPQSIIRYVPPTMSITQLLIRMKNAKGLHLFATAEEIDTVYKAFKKGFSSYSDALRCSFDNAEYGQDFASENSFSGIVPLYYNVLFSGTPKAMRRFYPDVEDGLVSRVTFVNLPDQFGKPHPVWGKLTNKQRETMDMALLRLNEISIQGEEVQDEHVMKMDFLCKNLEKWALQQQKLAVRDNDRARDIFCRRSAVVGFRAGMLAFFLWNEENTPKVRKDVCAFARWVANLMLKQQITRFSIVEDEKNTFPYKKVYDALNSSFTREELQRELTAQGYNTPVKNVLTRWLTIKKIERDELQRFNALRFKKTK